MVELVLISDNLEDEKKVLSRESPDNYYFTFIDICSKLCRSDAYSIKSEWGAKKDPFALVKVDNKVIRCFYSEKDDNIVDKALDFIKSLKESYD